MDGKCPIRVLQSSDKQERKMTMKYIITYWNHMKRKVSYLECESEEEVNTVLKVMERNGWVKKNGVWYHNIEA